MKELILMVGPPGSGKSTFAKNNYPNAIYINQDEQGREHLGQFLLAVDEGAEQIIVDRMGLNKAQRDRYLDPAKEEGYTTKIIVLHVPRQVCLDRCNARKDHLTIKDSATASRAVNGFFAKYERVEDNEADSVVRLGWDGVFPNGKERAIIVDIDGTLANIDHRLVFMKEKDTDSEKSQKKDWKNFFANIPGDTVNEWCKEIMSAFFDTNQVILCSGRPDDYQKVTEDWLEDNQVEYDKLFMRARGDFRRDDVIKQIILDFELKTRYDILFTVDDRKNVTDMWRKNGLTCLQCQEGLY